MARVFYVIAIAAILLAGCKAAPQAEEVNVLTPAQEGEAADFGTYQKLTPEQAKEMIDAGGVIILDVRTQGEYEEMRVPGAILLPNESIGTELPAELPDQEAAILVYCRSGRRSQEAAEKLLELGYKNVYDMGGINSWPYDVIGKPSGS